MTDTLFEQAYRAVRDHIEAYDEWPAEFDRWQVLDRLRHPDRVLRFTVRWLDDRGRPRQTPAWRVQYCNALGPYKGGLRFDPSVDEDTLLFLGFEQCLKNALTGLPMGGGKGGARFKAAEHSETEVLRFCQAFMDEYVRYGGEDQDVPAGDIGTGAREIGYLYGRFCKLTGRHAGALTGKPESLGGIAGRVEATGYGAVRFAQRMCETHGIDFEGSRVLISGAGNVALHAAERALRDGARVLTLSNSRGVARFGDEGLSDQKLHELKEKLAGGSRLEELDLAWMTFHEGETPWSLAADIALPCATQNELDVDAARALVEGGTRVVTEGANMPCTEGALAHFRSQRVLVGPGKAANAGGVAVSGFEMTQNATHAPWTRERVLTQLDDLMDDIHARCVERTETRDGYTDYERGANLAAYARLSRAIVASGLN